MITVRSGVFDDTELQVTAPGYIRRSTQLNGVVAGSLNGIGDVYLRVKMNAAGNAGCRFA